MKDFICLLRRAARILVFAFLPCFSAFAAPVSFDLQKVGIPEFSAAIFKGVLQKDFVISPDVLADDRKLSVSLSKIEPSQVLVAVKNALAVSGIFLTEKSGVYYLEKLQQQTPQSNNLTDLPLKQQDSFPGSAQFSLSGQKQDFSNSEKQFVNPQTIKTYKIKNRPVQYLASLVKFAGAAVLEQPDGEYLVYSVPDELQPKIESLLTLLDSPPQALTIRAAVIEYRDTRDSGRSISAAFDLLAGKLSFAYKAGQSLANTITYKGATIQAALSAISGDSRFNYLAQPTLRVLNNEKAKLTVGSEVPVRGQSGADKNGNPVQSIEYRTSGLVIELQPKISGDQITLAVDQQISSFATTTTSNIDSPTLLKRQAQTVVDTKRGDLIIMAGLEEQKTSKSVTGFSWLPRFLRSDSSSESNSQILLLIEVLPA